MTTASNCMMIDEVMYGMIPSENTEKVSSAPPENRLSRPTMPDVLRLIGELLTASMSTPGTGMAAPSR